MDISSLTVDAVRKGLRERNFSSVELATEALRYARAENPKTNAYLEFSEERALRAARRVDEKLARGEDPGPLAGVPVAVKDLCFTKGVKTTGGMPIYGDFTPDHDANVVTRLAQAGAVLLGKLHMT